MSTEMLNGVSATKGDVIQKGLDVLQADPKTRSYPLSERIAVLEKQGFSQNDAFEIMHRLHASSGSSTGGGMKLLSALDGVSGSWMWNTLIGAAMLGVAYLAYDLSTGDEEYPNPDIAMHEGTVPHVNPINAGQFAVVQDPDLSVTNDGASTHMLEEETETVNPSYNAGIASNIAGNSKFIDSELQASLFRNITELGKSVDTVKEALLSREPPAWAVSLSEQLIGSQAMITKDLHALKETAGVSGYLTDVEASIRNNKKITDFFRPDLSKKLNKRSYRRCASTMRSAVEAMLQKFDVAAATDSPTALPELAKQGCKALCMYLNNIVSNPSVPRYHRISTGNQTYKTMLGPLAGHEAVLQSIGFAQRGGYFEWAGQSSPPTPSSTQREVLPATLVAEQPVVPKDETDSAQEWRALDGESRLALLQECIQLLNDRTMPADTDKVTK